MSEKPPKMPSKESNYRPHVLERSGWETTEKPEAADAVEESTITPGPIEKKETKQDLRRLVEELQKTETGPVVNPVKTGKAYNAMVLGGQETTSVAEKPPAPRTAEMQSKAYERREERAQMFAEKNGIVAEREALLAAESKYKDAYKAHHGKTVTLGQKISPKIQKEYDDARLAWVQAVDKSIGAYDEHMPSAQKRTYWEGKIIQQRDTIVRAAEARTAAREAALTKKSQETFHQAKNWVGSTAKTAFGNYQKALTAVGDVGVTLIHEKALGERLSPVQRAKLAQRYGRAAQIAAAAVITTTVTGGFSTLGAGAIWTAASIARGLGSSAIGGVAGVQAGRLYRKQFGEKHAAELKTARRSDISDVAELYALEAAQGKGSREARMRNQQIAQVLGAVVGGGATSLASGAALHGLHDALTHAPHAPQAANVNLNDGHHQHVPDILRHPSAHPHPMQEFTAESVTAHQGEGAYKLFHDLQSKIAAEGNRSELAQYLKDIKNPAAFMKGLHFIDPKTGASAVIPEGATLSVNDHGQLIYQNGPHAHDNVVLLSKNAHGHFEMGQKFDDIKGHRFAPQHPHASHHAAHPSAAHTPTLSVEHAPAASDDRTAEIADIYKAEIEHKGFAPGWGSSGEQMHAVAHGAYEQPSASIESHPVAPAPEAIQPPAESHAPAVPAEAPAQADAPAHESPAPTESAPSVAHEGSYMNAHGVSIDTNETHLYAIPSTTGNPSSYIAYGPQDETFIEKVQALAKANPGKKIYFDSPQPVPINGTEQPWITSITYDPQNGLSDFHVLPGADDVVGRKFNPEIFINRVQ